MSSIIKSTHPFMYFTMCKIGGHNPRNRNCIFVLVENKDAVYRILQNGEWECYNEMSKF